MAPNPSLDFKKLPGDMVLLILYHYLPSKEAAVAAVILYAVITIAVTAVTIKTQSWYMLTVGLTGLMELTGWSARWAMISQPDIDIFKINQCFLVISPVLLAIVEYITMAKLLAISAANQGGDGDSSKTPAGILSKYVAWAFTASDFICCLLQGSGGALYVNPDKAGLARLLLLIGLFAQLAFFSLFILLLVYVQFSPKFGFRDSKLRKLWPVFVALYATTLLLHLRNIFRVVEFQQGFDGDLARQENMLYIFDFAPIYACFLLYTVMNYGFWLGPNAPAMKGQQLPHTRLSAGGKQHSVAAAVLSKQNSVVHVHCA